MSKQKILNTFPSVSTIIGSFFLTIYSFSQVDLNLTLSSNHFYQIFQTKLTHLGYFNRPLSTQIYLVILCLLFLGYFGLIYQAKNSSSTLSKYIKLLLIVSAILFFSYPAFSHDIFNYIFDARILVEHGANPWTHTALDFDSDLWTRFMRWTHRTYPYGPLWLPISSFFYLLGFSKFVPTLLSFKLLSLLSYLLTIFSLDRLAIKQKLNRKLVLVLFAFNPLVVVESLVSSHIDITMVALYISSLYLLINNQKSKSWVVFIASIGIKFVTGFSIIQFILYSQNRLKYQSFITHSLVFTYLATVFVITQREILPWYFILPFSLSSLLINSKLTMATMFSLSISLLLRYVPFIYIGEYSDQMKHYREIIFAIPLILTFPVFWKTYQTSNK